MEKRNKKAIVLMNLGSPDSTKTNDVARYLKEFLMDERVIDIPYLARLLLIKGIIVPFRAPKSAHAYKTIWTDEGSPLIVLTNQLQQAVQPHFDMPVEVAMRYGNPTAEKAYENILQRAPDVEEVILFPLYPHYAMSSYETAVEHMKKVHKQKRYSFSLTVIPPFYNDEEYINALSQTIKPFTDEPFDKILFSFHGIPERHVKKTDPTHQHCLKVADCCHVASPAHQFCYRHQTLMTAEAVSKQLNLPKTKWEQTFQSRLGRDQWLLPYTALRLTELPNEGIKKLLVVCPAFISDCLETLEEMAIEGRDIFLNAGGESFTAIPCLNINPLWVNALVSLVEKQNAHVQLH
ncbi:MAG: ferrochelatase [Bacteroidota bacterium]|nr:ferrochelatase [Bacteroidota bacterium]